MNIVILDGLTLSPGDISWEPFEKIGNVTYYDRTSASDIVERIGNADAIITNKTPITAEVINACPSIKYIGVLATGYNVVDISAARAKNIPVTNVPEYGTNAVAQYVFALLLELCSRVGQHEASVREGDWQDSVDFCYWKSPLAELCGKTMGIIGFGRIGRATAKIAFAFGMNVLAHSPSMDKSFNEEGVRYAELDELFTASDVVSLHCPLFESTKGLINKDTIAKMKDGAIIINTSRGLIVIDEDLKDALESGKLSGAGLDVLPEEPPRSGNVLIGAKNCIITPHIAWAPFEARQRLMEIAAGNLSAFIDGSPRNVVN